MRISYVDRVSCLQAGDGGEKQRGLVLFASIRRLNRLSHLYCKDTREQTQEVCGHTGSLSLSL